MGSLKHPPVDLSSGLTRRGLIGAVAAIVLGAPATLAQDTPPPEPEDPRVAVETITYPGKKGPLKAYVARPRNAPGKRPSVLIIHEIRGLNAHFRDLARRLAQNGMIAMVPDLASAQGFAEGSDEVRDFLQKLPAAEVAAEYQAALDALAKLPDVSGATGVIGFAWGGSVAAQLAALPSKPVRAAVLYYSTPASLDLVPKLNAALLLQYAEQDPRTLQQIEPIERKLIGYSKIYEQYVYEGAKPNFANESLPKWFNRKQADLAWERTLAFLKRQLGG